MGRITVDVNEEWLDAAQEILGTPTKVATINETVRTLALRQEGGGDHRRLRRRGTRREQVGGRLEMRRRTGAPC
jgi:Arc/MetJ family transcription regulator